MEDLKRLVRPNILQLTPYSSARDEFSGEGAVLLDANENPFNTPYNRYPDPGQKELKKQIASLKRIETESLFVGNGSDEAIDLLFTVFCEPGKDNVVSIHPTYGMYRVCADIHDVAVKEVPLKSDFSLDTAALRSAVDTSTKLLFICSPNNPTSNSFDPEEILALADRLNVVVVVDEAYIDFSKRQSLLMYAERSNRIVIHHTFSKAWGLAGIRLGIAIADPIVISLMSRVKYPYNVNTLTQQFAIKALKERSKMEKWVALILEERKKMERKLKKFRFVEEVYPSDANFLLVKVSKPYALYQYLMEEKIIVRDRSKVDLCEGSLRITIGSEEENVQLMGALFEYQRIYVESCEI